MAFIWRRRSTSIVKIIAILMAIWFFVAFFIYTDDARRESASNKWNAMNLPWKGFAGNAAGAAGGGSGLANNPNDNFDRDAGGAFEAGGGFGVGIVGGGGVGRAGQEGAAGDDEEEGVAADVPIAQPDDPNNNNGNVVGDAGDANEAEDNEDNEDINEGKESVLDNVVVHPEDKVYHGKLVAGNKGNNKLPPMDDGKSVNKSIFVVLIISFGGGLVVRGVAINSD